MKKKGKEKTKEKHIEIPISYDTEYYNYEIIEDNFSESDLSELDSEISDKHEEENNLKEVEEMNNNYSFLIPAKNKTKPKNKISKENTFQLKEEEYLSD